MLKERWCLWCCAMVVFCSTETVTRSKCRRGGSCFKERGLQEEEIEESCSERVGRDWTLSKSDCVGMKQGEQGRGGAGLFNTQGAGAPLMRPQDEYGALEQAACRGGWTSNGPLVLALSPSEALLCCV